MPCETQTHTQFIPGPLGHEEKSLFLCFCLAGWLAALAGWLAALACWLRWLGSPYTFFLLPNGKFPGSFPDRDHLKSGFPNGKIPQECHVRGDFQKTLRLFSRPIVRFSQKSASPAGEFLWNFLSGEALGPGTPVLNWFLF